MTDNLKKKVFIIEDEKHNRDLLTTYINDYFSEKIEVVGYSGSIAESIEFLSKNTADILLLDIELSDGQVFELLNQIDYKKYKLLFITGYSEHAIRAIKYSAVDYLLKPVIRQDLITAIKNILVSEFNLHPELDDLINRKKFELDEHLVINGVHSIEKILFEKISHMEADGIYTIVYHDNKKTISTRPIGLYEDILPIDRFIRCHKSFIVNKFYIKKVEKGRSVGLMLHNGVELQVAVRKKDEFMEWYRSE